MRCERNMDNINNAISVNESHYTYVAIALWYIQKTEKLLLMRLNWRFVDVT